MRLYLISWISWLFVFHRSFGVEIVFDPVTIDGDLTIGGIKSEETCSTVNSMNLDDVGMTRIPENMINVEYVRSITMQHNHIESIPEFAFTDIADLECLNLAHNRIPWDRVLAFHHRNLKTLIVGHQKSPKNNETTVLLAKGWFPNVIHLDVSGGNFLYLSPNFRASFPQLKSISFSNSEIGDIAKDLLIMLPPSVVDLHMERNSIETVNLQNLSQIEALYLDENPIQYLYNYSASLKLLSLSNCGLPTLPIDMNYDLFLTDLDLSSNLISYVDPNMFKRLRYLKNLSLSYNKMTAFPALDTLDQLEGLSLSYNFIEELTVPLRFARLRALSLRGNRIMRIQNDVFSYLYNLESLDLAENALTSLPSTWASNLTRLSYLNLKDNKFLSLVDTAVGRMPNLMQLYVRSKVITRLNMMDLQMLPSNCTLYLV